MKYKGAIFDLDGTLADTLEDIAGSMNLILAGFHFPTHPVNDYKLLVGRGLDNLVKEALPAEHRKKEVIRECLTLMIDDYEKNCIAKTHLYDGIALMLNDLVSLDIRLSVFSNKAEPLTLKIVKHLLPGIPFIRVSGARPDFPKKPDPAGAFDIAGFMELKPGEIVYAGDSDVDMLTANRAGMTAIGVAWGFRTRAELLANGAKYIVNQPEEIVHIINGGR